MRLKLHDYIKSLDEGTEIIDINYIVFFQHERLVHLIVTFFVGIAMVLFFIGFIITENILVFVLFLLLLCLFIPYIFHYYYLENNVQKLYDYYLQNKRITKK